MQLKIKNVLSISMFLVIFFIDFLTNQHHVLPQVFTYLPDIFAFGLAIFLVPKIISKSSFKIPAKYILIFLFFIYIVISGVVLNEISSETIISGIRNYFKYVFIFFRILLNHFFCGWAHCNGT